MSKCILVVEDQEDNRQILRDQLGNAGYELIEAVDGEQALCRICKAAPRPDPDGHSIADHGRLRDNASDQDRSEIEGNPDHCGDFVRLGRRRGQGTGCRLQ